MVGWSAAPEDDGPELMHLSVSSHLSCTAAHGAYGPECKHNGYILIYRAGSVGTVVGNDSSYSVTVV